MNRVIEIRAYRLKPGSRSAFHALMAQRSLPLLQAYGMDVVAFGPSLHDPDAYFLIRAFEDLDHLQASQAEFYATEAWRKGPREAIVALIEADANTVLWASPEAISALRVHQS